MGSAIALVIHSFDPIRSIDPTGSKLRLKFGMSRKTGTPVYGKGYLKREVKMRIVNVVLIFACAVLAGCVQTAHLSQALSGGGVERVEGRYRAEQVVNPLRGG